MFTKLLRASLSAAFLLGLAACGRDSGTDATHAADAPDQAVLTSARLAAEGNVAALLEHMLPPAEFNRIKAEWNDRTGDPEPDAEDRARFAEMMAKLTAPDAVEAIHAEIAPDLEQFDRQYKQQMPAMVAMGQGYAQSMVQQSEQLSAAEKEQATAIVKTLAGWVQSTAFTDPAKVREVLGIVTATARAVELKTLDEARALTFDQAAPKLAIVFDGIKKTLDVYGLSINEVLKSVRAEVLADDGTQAKVKVSYTLLGTALSGETEMTRVDGRWYAKDTIEKLREHAASAPLAAPKTDG